MHHPKRSILKQILRFCDLVSPSAEERQARSSVVSDITQFAQNIWPSCRVQLFGSELTVSSSSWTRVCLLVKKKTRLILYLKKWRGRSKLIFGACQGLGLFNSDLDIICLDVPESRAIIPLRIFGNARGPECEDSDSPLRIFGNELLESGLASELEVSSQWSSGDTRFEFLFLLLTWII